MLRWKTQQSVVSHKHRRTKEERKEIIDEEETSLWEKGLLGAKTAESLVHTLYFYNGKRFGQRTSEHRLLKFPHANILRVFAETAQAPSFWMWSIKITIWGTARNSILTCCCWFAWFVASIRQVESIYLEKKTRKKLVRCFRLKYSRIFHQLFANEGTWINLKKIKSLGFFFAFRRVQFKNFQNITSTY